MSATARSALVRVAPQPRERRADVLAKGRPLLYVERVQGRLHVLAQVHAIHGQVPLRMHAHVPTSSHREMHAAMLLRITGSDTVRNTAFGPLNV